jgi:hypothetical protein
MKICSRGIEPMTLYKNGLVLVPPPTLEKQLDALQASREVLAAEYEAARCRREEIAALRRELGELDVLRHAHNRRFLCGRVFQVSRRHGPKLSPLD